MGRKRKNSFRQRMIAALRRHFIPVLEREGFTEVKDQRLRREGVYPWRRFRGDFVELLEFHFREYGAYFSINLGKQDFNECEIRGIRISKFGILAQYCHHFSEVRRPFASRLFWKHPKVIFMCHNFNPGESNNPTKFDRKSDDIASGLGEAAPYFFDWYDLPKSNRWVKMIVRPEIDYKPLDEYPEDSRVYLMERLTREYK